MWPARAHPARPEFRVQLSDISVKRRDDIILYCEANTDVTASWVKGTQILENGGRISITHRGSKFFTLTIRDAREEDAGQYTINVHNSSGTASATATIMLLEYNKDWRKTEWQKKDEMKRTLSEFKPRNPEVRRLRFLLLGPVGAGKSSIINSVTSIFLGRPAVHALTAAGSGESFTTDYTSYEIEDQQRRMLPFVFNDIMGLENSKKGGVLTADIISALNGHISEGYKFNPMYPLSAGNHGYNSYASLNDKVHCLVNVLPADKINLYQDSDGIVTKMRGVREVARDLRIPQVVFLTHVDEACPLVREDLRNIYRSKRIKERMQRCSNQLGVPMNCIFPVKNYHEETEMDDQIDTLILSALKNITYFADDYVNRQKRNLKGADPN